MGKYRIPLITLMTRINLTLSTNACTHARTHARTHAEDEENLAVDH